MSQTTSSDWGQSGYITLRAISQADQAGFDDLPSDIMDETYEFDGIAAVDGDIDVQVVTIDDEVEFDTIPQGYIIEHLDGAGGVNPLFLSYISEAHRGKAKGKGRKKTKRKRPQAPEV